jgi:hypothetical protein
MYYHQLTFSFPRRVIVLADWYDGIGYNRSGLMEVKYNPNFASEDMTFLDQCQPVNFVLWPSNPYDFDFESEDAWRDEQTAFKIINR